MAIQFFLTNTTSDRTGGANFNLTLSTTSVASATSAFSCSANATEADFAWTVVGTPGAAGLSTGTFTVKRVITAAHANLRFNVGVARVNATGVVQSGPVMSTEDAGGTGTKTWNIVNPALGTWVAGDRLRVTYQTRNVSTGSRSWTETIGGTAVTVDTPFTASLQLVMPVATGSATAVIPTIPDQNVVKIFQIYMEVPDVPPTEVRLNIPVATATALAIPPNLLFPPSTSGAIQHTLLWLNNPASSSEIAPALGIGAGIVPNLQIVSSPPVAGGNFTPNLGEAPVPTVTVSVVTSPATATGAAPAPLRVGSVDNLVLNMPVATATGTAPIPIIGFTGLQLVMPVASGTGAANLFGMPITLVTVVATGIGFASPPAMRVVIAPSRALATGVGVIPSISIVGLPQGHIRALVQHVDRVSGRTIGAVERIVASTRQI
jgi:hypothetical protein